MEQAKKNLKNSSIFVLLFAALSLIQIIAELIFGELNSAEIPVGSPDHILLTTKIILLSIFLLLLLPKFYVGFKGLRIAKNPDASKKHIIWATIVFVFAVLNLIEPFIGMLKQGDVYENATTFFSVMLDAMIYYEYIKYAKAVAKASSEIAA